MTDNIIPLFDERLVGRRTLRVDPAILAQFAPPLENEADQPAEAFDSPLGRFIPIPD